MGIAGFNPLSYSVFHVYCTFTKDHLCLQVTEISFLCRQHQYPIKDEFKQTQVNLSKPERRVFGVAAKYVKEVKTSNPNQ